MRIHNYKLNTDYHYYNDRLKDIYLATEYVFIYNGYITIKKGYSWNGCSYVPDFKGTYYASLIHDALYQYRINRNIADLVFYDLMKRDKSKVSWIYYKGVYFFGKFFY